MASVIALSAFAVMGLSMTTDAFALHDGEPHPIPSGSNTETNSSMVNSEKGLQMKAESYNPPMHPLQ